MLHPIYEQGHQVRQGKVMMRCGGFLPKRILVVKAAGIGDLILAVPALRALRARFPDAAIDLLATPKCKDLLKHCPYLDDIYVIRTQGMANRIKVKDLWDILSLLYRLRKKRYDLLINLYHLFSDRGAFRMKILCKAIKAGLTAGRNTDGRGGFYDLSIFDSWDDPSYEQRHEVELNLDVVNLLGAFDPGDGPEFFVDDRDRASLQKVLDRQGISSGEGPCIILNIGGDAVYKRWPEEDFAVLGDLLSERISARLILVGGEEDRFVADGVITKMKARAADLVGRLRIPELAALIETSDLMVTNDTGPMHLAAALRIPVIALFGPGKPGRYGPYGPEGFHVVIHHPVSCSPCADFTCTERECMRKIRPEEVFQKIVERLALRQETCL